MKGDLIAYRLNNGTIRCGVCVGTTKVSKLIGNRFFRRLNGQIVRYRKSKIRLWVATCNGTIRFWM